MNHKKVKRKNLKKAKCVFDIAFLSFRIVIDCIKHAVRLFSTSAMCEKVLEFSSKYNVKSRSYSIQWAFSLDFGGKRIYL